MQNAVGGGKKKLDFGGTGTATVWPGEERGGRKRCAWATSLSQISVRPVCQCVRVFIIGPTTPIERKRHLLG